MSKKNSFIKMFLRAKKLLPNIFISNHTKHGTFEEIFAIFLIF